MCLKLLLAAVSEMWVYFSCKCDVGIFSPHVSMIFCCLWIQSVLFFSSNFLQNIQSNFNALTGVFDSIFNYAWFVQQIIIMFRLFMAMSDYYYLEFMDGICSNAKLNFIVAFCMEWRLKSFELDCGWSNTNHIFHRGFPKYFPKYEQYRWDVMRCDQHSSLFDTLKSILSFKMSIWMAIETLRPSLGFESSKRIVWTHLHTT